MLQPEGNREEEKHETDGKTNPKMKYEYLNRYDYVSTLDQTTGHMPT